MKRHLLIFIVCLLSIALGKAQEEEKVFVENWAIGPEFQAYPTGLTPGLVAYKSIGNNNYIHLKAGYNHVRHGDAGLHEDERGGGFGGSLGFNRLVAIRKSNFLAGVRCDLWYNEIDWKIRIDEPNEESGVSKVTVLQPTISMGYPIAVGKGFFLPQISFGAEINVETQGEETGEGLILLVGVSYLFD